VDGGPRPVVPLVPVVIGLIGGIASGNSSVARVLAERGAAVLDADAEVRVVLEDPALVAALVARHGRELLAADGRSLDRAAVARATFGHPEHLSHLEGLVHPRVRERLAERLAAHLRRRDVPAVVLDVPLLLESSPLADRCDLLLFVESPAPERRQRAMARRGWTGEEVARREAHQLAPEEKRRRADVVLSNDGDEAQLREKVLAWLAAAGGFEAIPRRTSRSGDRPDGREE
jgi:dephospho-CoA kinase